MKITFVEHSCFTVSENNCMLVFDYYRNELPKAEPGQQIYFFASHTHSDHFNPDIFKFAGQNVHYILSYDIEDKIKHRDILGRYPDAKENVIFMRYDEELILTLPNNLKLIVKTVKSTDRGVAFLVHLGEKCVFHAGDLNLWCWEKVGKAKNNDMRARFERELEKLKKESMDAAFLPLDHRMETYQFTGFDMYCRNLSIENIFPMHMWEHYELIDEIKKEEFASNYQKRIRNVNKPGKIWEI